MTKQYEGEYKWPHNTIVRAIVTRSADYIEYGNLYILGYADGRDNQPNYWVQCDDGTMRVLPETAFERARIT